MKLLHDRVLVLPDPTEEKSKGGIFIPDQARLKPKEGEAVFVGDGYLLGTTGEVKPLSVKVGDRIKYEVHAGEPLEYEGREFLLMRESNIIMIL